jgi:hypothetical protein
VGLIGCLILAACSSAPLELSSQIPPTQIRVPPPRLAAVHVKLRSDKRPIHEHGDRKYLGRSYLRASSLTEPTSVTLLRALVRDLVISGLCRAAGLVAEDQPYVLEVDIEHLAASFGEGLENLTLILPTSAIEGVCEIRLRFLDRDGRLFLDRTYRGTEEGAGSLVGGLEEAAATRLAAAIRQAIDRALPEIAPAVARFWEQYAGSGLSPARGRRSSTAR